MWLPETPTLVTSKMSPLSKQSYQQKKSKTISRNIWLSQTSTKFIIIINPYHAMVRVHKVTRTITHRDFVLTNSPRYSQYCKEVLTSSSPTQFANYGGCYLSCEHFRRLIKPPIKIKHQAN